jgi:AAA ATPase-like protein
MIGREPELAALAEFLGWGTPWLALLLTGGQGIRKTALWERGLCQAGERGMRVLAARPSGAEAELAFAGLYDLLAGIDLAAVTGLAAPQRHALEAALLRAEPTTETPDRFAIAAGFLSVLRTLAADEPLLLAVDGAGCPGLPPRAGGWSAGRAAARAAIARLGAHPARPSGR